MKSSRLVSNARSDLVGMRRLETGEFDLLGREDVQPLTVDLDYSKREHERRSNENERRGAAVAAPG